jgi:hypothetical protein
MPLNKAEIVSSFKRIKNTALIIGGSRKSMSDMESWIILHVHARMPPMSYSVSATSGGGCD